MNHIDTTEPQTTAIEKMVRTAETALHSAESAALGAMQGINDGAQRLRASALSAGDGAAHYVQREPLKAVLIAAASGAALMALLTLARRSGG